MKLMFWNQPFALYYDNLDYLDKLGVEGGLVTYIGAKYDTTNEHWMWTDGSQMIYENWEPSKLHYLHLTKSGFFRVSEQLSCFLSKTVFDWKVILKWICDDTSGSINEHKQLC